MEDTCRARSPGSLWRKKTARLMTLRGKEEVLSQPGALFLGVLD